jgi:GntR family transcriptional repressor for pyruvate dehydrogenase complex
MPLQPVSRRSVPDDVFEQVLGEVVSGALGPGEALPSERRLAEVLGVSRPAVREALQRMTQTRLVEVRHGGATRGAVAGLTATIAAYTAADDAVERQRQTLAYWDLVVDAADSITFRLLFNSLRAAYEPALEALAPLMAEEVGQVEAYRVLTAALGAGDPETARAAADRVLRPATESLLGALAALAAVPIAKSED